MERENGEKAVNKTIQIALVLSTMIGLSIAKYFMKDLDVGQINTVLLSLLTGLGVYHMSDTTPKAKP